MKASHHANRVWRDRRAGSERLHVDTASPTGNWRQIALPLVIALLVCASLPAVTAAFAGSGETVTATPAPDLPEQGDDLAVSTDTAGTQTLPISSNDTDSDDRPEIDPETVLEERTVGDQTSTGEEPPVLDADREAPAAAIPGETVAVELTADALTNVTGPFFIDDFEPEFSASMVQDVQINDEPVTPDIIQPSPNGLITILDTPIDEGGTITVSYTVTVPTDAPIGSEHVINGTVSADEGDDEPDDTVIQVVEPSVEHFENEAGVIDTPGVRDAVRGWQNGVVETDLLTDVIDTWAD